MRFHTLFAALFMTLAACEGDTHIHIPADEPDNGPVIYVVPNDADPNGRPGISDDTDVVEENTEELEAEEVCDKEPFVNGSPTDSWESYSYPIMTPHGPYWSYSAGTTNIGVGARIASLAGDICDEGFWLQDMFMHLKGLPSDVTLTQVEASVEIDGNETTSTCTTFSNGTGVVGYRCFPSFGQPGHYIGPHDIKDVQVNVRGLNAELPAGTELRMNLCMYFEDEATGESNLGDFGVPVEFCMHADITLY